MVHPTQAVIVMKLMLRDINPTLQLVYNYALQKCIIKAIHKLKFQTLFCSLIWWRAIVRFGQIRQILTWGSTLPAKFLEETAD